MISADFYDKAYFTDGSKSNYAPYGPGSWAVSLADMIHEHCGPASALDVGCAYGFVAGNLLARGVDSYGFDISEYAVSKSGASPDRIWQGDATDEAAYRELEVDLIIGSEMPEHLTEEQSERFLRLALKHARSALLLIAMYGDDEEGPDLQHEKDLSHINIKPVGWWVSLARQCGWEIDDASPFNDDDRSKEMQWAGRFLLLRRPE